jgi:acetyl esterase/lipase
VIWILGGLGGLVAAGVGLFVGLTRNPAPGPFYTAPDAIPSTPGSILRTEPFTDGVPAGARAVKVLYVSTDPEGRPIAVSGLVIAPERAPAGPRPILAWAHGTVGVDRACAPSLTREPLKGIPDMAGPLANGWVLTLADYPGLGTPGPHPYLVGESEGRAVLDLVRAAHALDLGVPLDRRYAIWGHSQGGHAALFAGQLAPSYLPEQELVGVAALAPATLLRDNMTAVAGTQSGNVLTIMAVASWTRYYPDVDDGVLTDAARRPARLIAGGCLGQPSRFRLLVGALRLPDRVVDIDIAADPVWGAHLDRNTPTPEGIAAPLFVAQGLADEIVAPTVTADWVARRCAAGAAVESTTYPDVTHGDIVGPGGAAALAWTEARFAGAPAGDTCPS